jgi:hypothetical protein
MGNPSVMVLLKNECYWAPYVLWQTKGLFDSYVIYDIGSTDGTQNIIKRFVEQMDGKADFFVRYLPHCPPEVQGAFRNSMPAEGDRDVYFLLDGDELYTQEDLIKIPQYADNLAGQAEKNIHKKYGVFRRTEVTGNLKEHYLETRTHHRLYHSTAWWTGTHPGERPFYELKNAREVDFPDVMCYHMHNTQRSPDKGVPGRERRLDQGTYHPGHEFGLLGTKLLDILPILRAPIEDFPVNPYLKTLQEEYRNAQ